LAYFVLENTQYDVIGMMRWLDPMDNLYHLTKRINNKARISPYYADLNGFFSISRMLRDVSPL
jgi:GDP-4-dehydro-6-deoxy-D-mannose reductase